MSEVKIHCKYDVLKRPGDLLDSPKNRNTHSLDQVKRLAKLYTYHGIRHPIIVSRTSGFIVAGHGRKQAAIEAGLTEFPVVYQDFDSDEAEYAFIQADNAIAAWAKLDFAGINADLADLGPDFDLDMLGIRDFVLEPAEKFDPKTEPNAVPDVPRHAKAVRGDLWILGPHRVLCGDSTAVTDLERLMAGEKADCVFTDPPYGIDYDGGGGGSGQAKRKEIQNDGGDSLAQFLRDVFAGITTIARPGAPVYVCSPVTAQAGEFFTAWKDIGWHYQSCCVWVKHRISFTRFDYHTKHEFIHYGWVPGAAHPWEGDRTQSTVWEYDRPAKSELHPTMKPVELVEYALTNSSKRGSLVLDVFGGSGTTLIACQNSGRKANVCELDPHYVDVIIKRWQGFTGQQAVREDGLLWDSL